MFGSRITCSVVVAITEQPLQLCLCCRHRSMDVEQLISLVQDRRPIFDPSDPLHRNRDAISALFASEWKASAIRPTA